MSAAVVTLIVLVVLPLLFLLVGSVLGVWTGLVIGLPMAWAVVSRTNEMPDLPERRAPDAKPAHHRSVCRSRTVRPKTSKYAHALGLRSLS